MSDTKGEMLDTAPAQRKRYYDLLRALTPEERARKAASLSRSARVMALAGIRERHPDAAPHEIAYRLGGMKFLVDAQLPHARHHGNEGL